MNTFHAVFKSILFHLCSVSGEKLVELFIYKERFMGIAHHHLINFHGRLLFTEKIFRVDVLIKWWTLVHFLAKFQGRRLLQCRRSSWWTHTVPGLLLTN